MITQYQVFLLKFSFTKTYLSPQFPDSDEMNPVRSLTIHQFNFTSQRDAGPLPTGEPPVPY